MNHNEHLPLASLILFLVALPVVFALSNHVPRTTNPRLGPVTAYLKPATVGLGYFDAPSSRFHTQRTGVVIASDARTSPVYYVLTVPFQVESLEPDVNVAVDRLPLDAFVSTGEIVAEDQALCLIRVTKTPYQLPMVPFSPSPDASEFFSVAIVDESYRTVAGVPSGNKSHQESSFKLTTPPLHDANASSLGAPLTDKDGYLLGIFSGRHKDRYRYIGLDQIRAFLRRYGIEHLLWQPPSTIVATRRLQHGTSHSSRFRRFPSSTIPEVN